MVAFPAQPINRLQSASGTPLDGGPARGASDTLGMMGRLSDLFRQLLVDGVGITLAPWCVVGVILILSGPRPLRKAIAFLLGAATTMTAILIVCELLVGRLEVTSADTASYRVEWVKLVLALLLLGYGLWRWSRPPVPPSTPRWLTLIDRLNVPTAYAIGLVMPNPVFAAAGSLQIVKADLSTTGHRRLAGLLHPGLVVFDDHAGCAVREVSGGDRPAPCRAGSSGSACTPARS